MKGFINLLHCKYMMYPAINCIIFILLAKSLKLHHHRVHDLCNMDLCYKDFGSSLQCFGDVTDLVNKSGLLEKNQRRKLYTVILFSSGWQASLKK